MAALVVLLLVSGGALLVAELALPAHGVLATTGIVALIAGILLALFDAIGCIAVALVLTAPVIAGLGALALLALRLVLAAGGKRARCGSEGLVGHVGVVRRPLDPLGHVAIDGELWRARPSWDCEGTAPAEGEPVVVDRVDGLTLSVRRAEVWEVEPWRPSPDSARRHPLHARGARGVGDPDSARVRAPRGLPTGAARRPQGPGARPSGPDHRPHGPRGSPHDRARHPATGPHTRDNVPAKVNAVTYFRVVDAPSSVVEVERYLTATSQIAQTTLRRSVLGEAELDMLLSERERLNEALQQIIDEQTDPWAVKDTAVEIKDVGIPPAMQRAMARQAEAERERRAKVIHAEGEYQASERLRDAAEILSVIPAALQLRYLQTLAEVGSNENSTIVFPLPLDVIRPLLDHAGTTPAATGITRSDADAGSPRRVGEKRVTRRGFRPRRRRTATQTLRPFDGTAQPPPPGTGRPRRSDTRDRLCNAATPVRRAERASFEAPPRAARTKRRRLDFGRVRRSVRADRPGRSRTMGPLAARQVITCRSWASAGTDCPAGRSSGGARARPSRTRASRSSVGLRCRPPSASETSREAEDGLWDDRWGALPATVGTLSAC
jgi:membrane protein implicated in regulation of membrane protease activity